MNGIYRVRCPQACGYEERRPAEWSTERWCPACGAAGLPGAMPVGTPVEAAEEERRYVVRVGKVRGDGIYLRDMNSQPNHDVYEWRTWKQANALRMTREDAESRRRAAANPTNGGDPLELRVVRIISRAEAVARERERVRVKTLEGAAARLDAEVAGTWGCYTTEVKRLATRIRALVKA